MWETGDCKVLINICNRTVTHFQDNHIIEASQIKSGGVPWRNSMRNVEVLRTVFHPRKLAHAVVSYSHGDQAYISFKVVGHGGLVCSALGFGLV